MKDSVDAGASLGASGNGLNLRIELLVSAEVASKDAPFTGHRAARGLYRQQGEPNAFDLDFGFTMWA